jgi:hypothetical protein
MKLHDGRTMTFRVAAGAALIKDLMPCPLGNFREGDEIFAASGAESVESAGAGITSPPAVDWIFSIDSACMMAAGNVNPYEYGGRFSLYHRKEGTVDLRITGGASRTVLIAPYTKIKKNLKDAGPADFKEGEQVFCETRFRGLEKHAPRTMAALYLHDPLSYLASKLSTARGSLYRAGIVKDTDPAGKWILFDREQVLITSRTLFIPSINADHIDKLKGKKAVLFPLAGEPRTAGSLFEPRALDSVMASFSAFRQFYRGGGIAPIAAGTVIKADRGKNLFFLQSRWNHQVVIRISPGNTRFITMRKGSEPGGSLDDLRPGGQVLVLGYPPDQATEVIIQ